MNNNKLLCLEQYGFRPGHSTELAALQLVNKITEQMDIGKIPLSIHMDLSKAFDTHQLGPRYEGQLMSDGGA